MLLKLHTNKIFSIILLIVLFSVSSCVKNDFDAVDKKELTEIPEGTATMTISELKNIRGNAADNTTTEIPENTVIVGQVISSDVAGNIYKELFIQDETAGITVRIDGSVLYTTFKFGQEIAIDCNGLVLGSYGARIQIGIPALYNGEPSAGQIPLPIALEHVTYGTISEVTPKVITISDANTKLIEYAGTYVRIENVQVSSNSEGKSYAEKEVTTNRYFSSCKTGTDIILRTSGYSDFHSQTLPNGMGSIEGTLTRFRNTPQLIINSTDNMLGFTGTTEELPECEAPSQIGTTPPLVNTLNEPFDGTKYAVLDISGWNNIIEAGTKGYFYNEYSGNTYANLSVYKSGEARKAWLITPLLNVAAAANKNMSFDSRGEYVDGATFNVYVSSDYDGSKAPSEFSWTEINTTIGPAPSDAYGEWTTSGDFDLSTYGNVVVAFVFEGEEDVKDGGYSIDNFVFNEGGGGGTEPGEYYSSATGKTGYELKTALYSIISSATVDVGYSGLWTAYYTTDDKYGNSEKLWDIYSDIPNPSDPDTPDGDQPNEYEYTIGEDQNSGTNGGEGTNYNREHTMPQSWFNESSPMVSDIFQVVPTDSKVNGERGSYPYGEVSSASWTSVNGSMRGSNNTSGYSGTVFEPIDTYKGDIARIYFYMATRYENIIGNWESNSTTADDVLDGSSDKVFEDWQLEILKKWNKEDPVSQKEIERNEAVYSLQKNRNPFVDHPEYVDEIWGN